MAARPKKDEHHRQEPDTSQRVVVRWLPQDIPVIENEVRFLDNLIGSELAALFDEEL
jgi:hypothetical protein